MQAQCRLRGWTRLVIFTMTSSWMRWRLKSPASWLFTQLFSQAQIKENVKAPHHWSPHKGPVTRKMFPFDDFIMIWPDIIQNVRCDHGRSCDTSRWYVKYVVHVYDKADSRNPTQYNNVLYIESRLQGCLNKMNIQTKMTEYFKMN